MYALDASDVGTDAIENMSYIPWPTSEFHSQVLWKLAAVHFKHPLLCFSAWELCPALKEIAQPTHRAAWECWRLNSTWSNFNQ